MRQSRSDHLRAGLLATVAMIGIGLAVPAGAVEQALPADLPSPGATLPGNIQPRQPLADTWRSIRQGEAGTVNNFPDPGRGRLIQSEGESWRSARNGWLMPAVAIGLAGVLVALSLFYAVRGKIRLDNRPSGRTILRFSLLERFGHWLTACSFLLLAATGLNMLFGRHVIEPLMGKDVFSALSRAGKWVHNVGGFAFIAGLVLIFALWARDNLWDRYDWTWIKEGGGLLKKGRHPPAARFNFGEKSQFWMVVLLGSLVSLTGLNLLFPLALTDLLVLQLMQILHALAAMAMLMAILGHIYVGTIGTEGALSAMTTGYVDEEWAREHHSAWLEEINAKQGEPPAAAHGQPAE